jgi:hypothetical protein
MNKMNINTSIKNNTNIMQRSYTNNNQKQKNDYLSNLKKQVVRLDKQIADIKGNEQFSPLQKKEKLKEIEEQKKELVSKITEAQIKEKMNEVEEKMEKAEEIEEKRKAKQNKPLTPQEKIKAELGVEYISSRRLIKASNSLDAAKQKHRISKELKQEAKILIKEYETDMGRGQSVDSNDYRLNLAMSHKANADVIDKDAMNDLEKSNKMISKVSEKAKKEKEVDAKTKNKIEEIEINENIQEKRLVKYNSKIGVGSKVDVSL